MNRTTIIGNLTTNPVMKTVNVKNVPTKVVNFSIAVNERGRDEPTYFRCHAWRGLAETCASYLKKGRKVWLAGPVHLNSYKDSSNAIRYAMEIRVEDIEFLDAKPVDETPDELEQLSEDDFPCA
jgi:single-strand DNA-binding protein